VGWLVRSRRYSPLNRAHGLRRVPDEPVGLGLIASLTLHAALAMSLIHLTDAPPQRAGADITAVLADLASVAPVSPPGPDPVPGAAPSPRPAPSYEQPAEPRSIATETEPIPTSGGLNSATHEANARLVKSSALPAPVSTPTAVVAPPLVAPIIPSDRVGSGLDGPTLVAAASTPIDVPAPAIDTRLDAGWPEPPLTAATSSSSAQPAKPLTPVPGLRPPVPDTPDPAPPTRLAREPYLAAPELPPVPLPPIDRPKVGSTTPQLPTSLSGLPTPTASSAPVLPDREEAQPVVAQREARPSSIFGLNRESTLVRLDGPRTWITDRPTQTISGTVLGGMPERLAVSVNGIPAEVTPTRRTFEAVVLLSPGTNELRAVVSGPDGAEATDTITVQYVPRPSSNGITLTSPADGLTLGPDDPPVAVVEGEVDDKSLTTVWIVANARRIPVTVSEGRFRHTLLVPDPLVRLWAEAPGGDTVRRSDTVTIRTAGARPASGVLVMQWPAGTDGSSVEVSVTWRAQPERLDTVVHTTRLAAVGEANGAPAAMFHLRSLKPGVYTLMLRYRGATPLGDVQPTLYLPNKDRLAPRALRPIALNSAGRRIVAKVLMPQAVLWSQDDWFSGRSESVDTLTKFRIPEGISWVERKADVQ
jgi:hypothetical protein